MRKLLIALLFATGCTTIGVKRECDYQLPENYVLAYERYEHKYAISVDRGVFLPNAFFLQLNVPAPYAALFEDSCKAKAYCHKYVRETYGDFIDVKELKK